MLKVVLVVSGLVLCFVKLGGWKSSRVAVARWLGTMVNAGGRKLAADLADWSGGLH